MQHHFDASAIDATNLGTIEDDSWTVALKQRFQFLQEGSGSIQGKLLWHLHDDDGPTSQHYSTPFEIDLLVYSFAITSVRVSLA
jgi:hypothetical protein